MVQLQHPSIQHQLNQLFQFLIGMVQRYLDEDVNPTSYIYIDVSIPHRYGTTKIKEMYEAVKTVSIPHRYGTTDVYAKNEQTNLSGFNSS